MLTKKDYCDLELRLGLRDIGYPMSTCQINDGPIQMPKITLYEAQKWLREERNIDVLPRRGCITNGKQHYQVVVYINYNRNQILLDNDGEDYSSPEEALSEGLRASIKILQDEQKENN